MRRCDAWEGRRGGEHVAISSSALTMVKGLLYPPMGPWKRGRQARRAALESAENSHFPMQLLSLQNASFLSLDTSHLPIWSHFTPPCPISNLHPAAMLASGGKTHAISRCAALEREIKGLVAAKTSLFAPQLRELRASLRQACVEAILEDYLSAKVREHPSVTPKHAQHIMIGVIYSFILSASP
jgi:hypothetical protein